MHMCMSNVMVLLCGMSYIVMVYVRIRNYIWSGITFLFLLMTCFDMSREGKEYPNTSCPDALVPPPFLIPRCDHHEEAHIKQSRHPSTIGRAYYCHPYKSVSNICMYEYCLIWHLQVSSLTKVGYVHILSVDRLTRCVWSTNSSFSCSLRSFKRWVPPPPMTDEEKEEATTRRVLNPPQCKCGYCSELVNPPPGLDYTPFSVVRFLYR
jgi:hypothetical protein